jgi:hypothetical protein
VECTDSIARLTFFSDDSWQMQSLRGAFSGSWYFSPSVRKEGAFQLLLHATEGTRSQDMSFLGHFDAEGLELEVLDVPPQELWATWHLTK